MNPLISVIVPIYNVEEYLPRCLDSIVNQTYQNLEIILVDDGSPDGCGAICDQYARQDARIRVIHKEKGGVSSARNAGLDRMQGEYLMFVDSDDWLSLDAVQVLYDRLVQDGSDMAVGRHTDVYEDGSRNDQFLNWMTDGCCLRETFIEEDGGRHYLPVCAWGKIYKREVFGDIRFPDVKHAEDLAVFPAVLDRCRKISTSGQIVLFYYQRRNSMIHTMNEAARRDELKAKLLMVKYLWQQGAMPGANLWFDLCVRQVFLMRDQTEGLRMMREHLGTALCRELFRKQTLKTYIKWLALRWPLVERLIRMIQKLRTEIKYV